MITREGLETSVVLASLAQNVATVPLLKAGISGIVLAGIIGALWIKYGKKVPLSLFFKWSSAFLWVFSIQLGVYAFHEVMEWCMEVQFFDFGGMINYTFWHDLTEAYAPSGTYGQYVSLMMLLFPVLFIHHYWKSSRNSKNDNNLNSSANMSLKAF
jgi:high-affinity iron transporter